MCSISTNEVLFDHSEVCEFIQTEMKYNKLDYATCYWLICMKLEGVKAIA